MTTQKSKTSHKPKPDKKQTTTKKNQKKFYQGSYSFKFSLLNSWDPDAGMNVEYTGTLTLNVGATLDISGTINFDAYFTQPIDIQGASTEGLNTGILINASGSSSKAQINLDFILGFDGSTGADYLLGGMVSLFDVLGQEWNSYIIQAV